MDNLMYALARGPDARARVYNRTFINGFFYRNTHVERSLSTQNSGIVVKGDESTGNIDWYGVIKKIICLDFGSDKEVVLFQCEWFDVPSANKNQSRGYNKDKYGIIDVDTTVHKFKNDPYILGIQAEQVFYVRDVKKPNWSSVIKMKPRNLFSMPSTTTGEDLSETDADILDVGVREMTIPNANEDISSWSRSGVQGASGVVSDSQIIEPVDAPNDELESDDDDTDDDTYMNDGHVAPLVAEESEDEGFFV